MVAGWRRSADLSFADLITVARRRSRARRGTRFVVLAQVWPVTGQTNYPQDSSARSSTRSSATRARGWRSVEADTHAIGAKECGALHPGAALGPADRPPHPRGPVAFFARQTGNDLERYLPRRFRTVAHGRRRLVPFDLDEARSSEHSCGRRRDPHRRRTLGEVASPNAVSHRLHRPRHPHHATHADLKDIGFEADPWCDVPKLAESRPGDGRGDVLDGARCVPAALELDDGDGAPLCHGVTSRSPAPGLDAPSGATYDPRDPPRGEEQLADDRLNALRVAQLWSQTSALDALMESERRIRSIAIVHRTLSRCR